MSFKRRSKGKRYAGSKTHGRGRKNRTRGLGNRGGVGMSGSGKRGDQKKTLLIHLYGNDYFGKDPRGAGLREKKRLPTISLRSLIEQLPTFIKKGMAKEQKGLYDVNLPRHKIIGNDAKGVALKIHARAVSEGATKAIAKAGGSVTTSASSD